MKTTSLTYPSLLLIDTAPLAARYAVLANAILAMVTAGRPRESTRLAHKVVRLVRALTRCEAHNHHLRRKLDMLCDRSCRERVLRELGGIRKLKLWEAARKRIEARRENPPEAARLSISEQTPEWLLTPERIAESERLKAHARMCGRATAHPLILRDRVKMDFEGEFRLAPLPRGERVKGQPKIYTENSIVDYDWNAVPFAKVEGFGPASVWPVEFYAAMGLECEPSSSVSPTINVLNSVISAQAGTCFQEPLLELDPRLRGDDKDNICEDKGERNYILLLPLADVLSPKVHRDLLGSLTS